MFCSRCVSAAPGFRAIDGVTFAYLFIGGLGIILYLPRPRLAFGGRAGRRAGVRVRRRRERAAAAHRADHQPGLSAARAAGCCRARSIARHGAGARSRASRRALIALGRDQVALLELYVLAGFVLAHWLDGAGKLARLRASIEPLIAGGIAGLVHHRRCR